MTKPFIFFVLKLDIYNYYHINVFVIRDLRLLESLKVLCQTCLNHIKIFTHQMSGEIEAQKFTAAAV